MITEFTWIGNMEESVAVCGVSKGAGIARFDDMHTKEAIFGATDYRTTLRELARQNVFVTHTYASGSEDEYRLHPLFRSFLTRWLTNEVGVDEVRRLHRACAAHFAGAQQWSFALDHFTEAGSAEDVAGMSHKKFKQGKFTRQKVDFFALPGY